MTYCSWVWRNSLRNATSIVVISGLITLLSASVTAQVVPDNTLRRSERSTFSRGRVSGGATRGSNLFHSFQEFNVRNRQQVRFGNPAGIENIFTRVTGRDPSRINGTLGVDGNASLFLLNPNGIIFGRNAQLDLNGSFIGSTAESFIFSRGREFSAVDPQSPLDIVRINVPIGLQFGENPEPITVRAQSAQNQPLPIGPGETLALVGGDINFEGGRVITSGIRVDLGGVNSNSRVQVVPAAEGFSLRYRRGTNYQDIRLSNSASITAGSGGELVLRARQLEVVENSLLQTNTATAVDGGNLNIRIRDLRIEESGEVSTTTSSRSRTGGNGGSINVRASGLVELRGEGSLLAADVQPRARGNGGNLRVTSRNLLVEDGGQISTTTFGAGDGGNLTLNASESVRVIQSQQQPVFTTQFVIDRNGNVVLDANGNPVFITTLTTGTRSGIFTRSGQVRRLGQSQPPVASGNGGTLSIQTQTLSVISSPITTEAFSVGNPGKITITASDRIQLNNGAILSGVRYPSRLQVDGGNLEITTGQLILRNMSSISTSNERLEGRAGDIAINTTFVIASPVENSDITSNARDGAGGEVTVTAQSILGIQPQDNLTPNSDITAFSQTGTDGAILFDTPDVDPSRGVVELPVIVVDPNSIVEQRCQPGQRLAVNRLTITGSNLLNTDSSIAEQRSPLIEAQGWLRDDGIVKLRATVSPATLYSSWISPSPCYSSEMSDAEQ